MLGRLKASLQRVQRPTQGFMAFFNTNPRDLADVLGAADVPTQGSKPELTQTCIA